jgi:hypothetical protein
MKDELIFAPEATRVTSSPKQRTVSTDVINCDLTSIKRNKKTSSGK